jgi:hypothetical protein
MKKNFGDKTHDSYPVPPERFRAMTTGIGQSQAMSEQTGRRRAQYVIDTMPASQRAAVAPCDGYPAPVSDMYGTADYPAARRMRGN